MRLSVELVPRGTTELQADASLVLAALPSVDAFNIPDLTRFPLRSWEACAVTRPLLAAGIPHIRAIDIPPGEALPMADAIKAAGVSEVLVVRGDPPRDLSQRTWPNTSEDIIRRFKRHHPELRVYAAFDPYRLGLRDELTGVARKLDAGADGFFTQPLFDLRLLDICMDMLEGQTVYWGVAPVLGARAKAYWETTNHIVFPPDFVPEMAWNKNFARAALKLIRERGGNAYLMPIRVDLASYLPGLLEG
jgi:methylenetetrahydrofolate reductase (NADPH)